MHVVTIMNCCVTNHPKTSWLKTKIICFAYKSSVWAGLMGNIWSLLHTGSGGQQWIGMPNLAHLHCWLDGGEAIA